MLIRNNFAALPKLDHLLFLDLQRFKTSTDPDAVSRSTSATAVDEIVLWLACGPVVNFDVRELATSEQPEGAASGLQSGEKARLARGLVQLLREVPVEYGGEHEAEALIERTLQEFPDGGPIWVSEIVSELLVGNTSLAADLIRCVGKIDYETTKPFAAAIVSSGLRHESVEVREATVNAIEHWRDASFADLLGETDEPVEWMARYIDQVILDMSASS